MQRRPAVAVCALALALAAGCGGHAAHDDRPLPTGLPTTATHAPASSGTVAADDLAEGEYNLADVMFLQMAIANHTQGIDLVGLARDRPVRPELRELAAAIETTQRWEIERMRSWLAEWDQPAQVDDDLDAHAHHGGMPITDAESVRALSRVPDADFEADFTALLTGHQHNAVEMARYELRDGANESVREFADRIVRSRTGQISALLAFGNG